MNLHISNPIILRNLHKAISSAKKDDRAAFSGLRKPKKTAIPLRHVTSERDFLMKTAKEL
jgi:hypothetical protein